MAVTAQSLFFRVGVNSLNGSAVLTFRKNGGNGNLTVTVGAGTTGIFEDVTNTDSAAVGDTVDWQLAIGGTSGSMNCSVVSAVLGTASGVALFDGAENAALSTIAPSTTYYFSINGFSNVRDSTEANWQKKRYESGTISNLHIVVTSNGLSSSFPVRLRKNGGNGNEVITVGAGSTGDFEDVTHTDAFVSGDLVNSSIITGIGGTTAVVSNVYYHETTAGNVWEAWVGSQQQSGTIKYEPFVGGSGITVFEARSQVKVRVIKFTMASLSVFVQTNPGTTVVKSRKNGADGNQVISTSSTGQFVDVTHTDAASPGDLLDYYISPGGSMYWNNIGVTVTTTLGSVIVID